MEKQAQEIGQFLYTRGREGETEEGGSSGTKQEGKTERKRQCVLCNFSVALILFYRHTNMSDCQEFPIIIKGA